MLLMTETKNEISTSTDGAVCLCVELGRYRFCKSVFGFLVGFSKVGIGFGIGFSKYRDIGFGFSARTYHCLSNNTIADTLRSPLSPE